MSRVRLIAFVISIAGACALASLCLPAGALAGTYTWNLSSDFTSSSPGANPDRDHYGAKPWSYVESAPAAVGTLSHDPSTFSVLPTFETGTQGGLADWADPSAAVRVGVNPTDSVITSGALSFPAHQLVMEPSGQRFAAIGWTSPLSHAATVQVTGTASADAPSILCLPVTWTIDQNGSALAQGTPGQPLSASPTVPPGGTIYVTVSPGLLASSDCSTTSLTLQIQATETSGPPVTLDTPGPGAVIIGRQPSFSGSAGNRFGHGNQVTVHVYPGATAGGTAVEDLTVNRSGNKYSATPSPPLADGVYTARAQQNDLSTPPDVGLSAPVTFTVHNAVPSIQLDSPPGRPLDSATPTLTGKAGTAAGDDPNVGVGVFAGSDTNGARIRLLRAPVGAGGRYTVRVEPALDDGRYTAIAVQQSPNGLGFSQPRTFRIKTRAPLVRIDQPADAGRTTNPMPLFSGAAGTALGDSPSITVALFAGHGVTGRRIGTLHASAIGSGWSRRWPRRLAPGLYTAEASQTDDAGHTGRSAAHTFRILPLPPAIGRTVRLDRAGIVSVVIGCRALDADVCTGSVQIATLGSFQPVAGGPVGRLVLEFAQVTIPGGRTVSVRARVSAADLAALRRVKRVPVLVTADLRNQAGRETVVRARRLLSR